MLSPKVMSMTPINFITEIIDKNPIGNQTPKSPMRPPLVYIEDHTGAQEKSLFSKFNLEVKALYGIKQHGMTPLNLNAQLSYGIIDRLSLLVSAEKQWSLFNIDGSKWYANSTLLGGGMAYVWWKEEGQCFDVRLQVLSTIGTTDFKSTVFDIATIWYGTPSKRRLVPLVGFGLRHDKSHTTNVRDWTGVYAMLGIRF